MVPGDSKWFLVLDLKDSYFCIPTDEQAQLLFPFEWQDPVTKAMFQYSWTVFPQAFKGSLTTFGEISAKDLRDIQLKSRIILQYVDGLRIASNTYKDCLLNTTMIPNHVAERGYKLSLHRAQLCKHEVVYLGLQL